MFVEDTVVRVTALEANGFKLSTDTCGIGAGR